ncbi:MAG: FAD-dependent oxidoreductase [Spirochaetota bacterium]
MTFETDVLVVGASASGVCAAVQAARMGRDVVLCEPTGWIGGMLTAAGVSAVDGDHNLPSGLWGELREELRVEYGGADALATGWVSHTLFDPRAGERVLRRWIAALPAITLVHGASCTSVLRERDRVTGAGFGGIDMDRPDALLGGARRLAVGETLTVRAGITIFADELGDAVELAGLRWRTGLEAREETGEAQAPEAAYPHPQDLTWAATVSASPGFAVDRPGPLFPPGDEYAGILGDPAIEWDRLLDYGRLPNGLVMLNWPAQDVHGDYLEPARRQAVLASARAKTSRLVDALRAAYGEDTVGLPDIYPGHLAAIPYIREARRIRAVDTLTIDDLVAPAASRSLRTSVAVGDYPVDHHRGMDPDAPTIDFPRVCAFGVPYGVMVPSDCDGVLVAEKSIGVTGLVNGCTRLQPVAMQLGQAAGAAAALCVERGAEPRTLAVGDLQEELLVAHGFLAPAMDAPPSDRGFASLHRAIVAGDLKLAYLSEGWANKAFVRPEAPLEPAEVARLAAAGRPARRGMTRREYATATYGAG